MSATPGLTLGDLVPPSVRRVFHLVGIAEQEIEDAGNPQGVRLSDLVAPREIVPLADAVYRSHARELVARAGTPTPMSVPTLAELLVRMHATSLVAPLNRSGEMVYHHLFRQVMGDELYFGVMGGDTGPTPEWPGQLQEELGAMRRLKVNR